jgi:hypothetical protein
MNVLYKNWHSIHLIKVTYLRPFSVMVYAILLLLLLFCYKSNESQKHLTQVDENNINAGNNMNYYSKTKS